MTEQKALTAIDEVRVNLDKMKPEFEKALPAHVSVDKLIRTAMTAIQTNPALLRADRRTLFASCLKAATDGLIPDGREAALVTYDTKNGTIAGYLPMVGGILKKVRNSGELSSITSQLVYENDEFDYHIDDDGEHVKHKPAIFSQRGKILGVYALAKTKDGATYIEVMNTNEVMAIKECSRAKNGPWSGAFQYEMWRKSAIRRLAKRLPMSTDLEEVIRRDDEFYDLEAANARYQDKGKKIEALVNGEQSGVHEVAATEGGDIVEVIQAKETEQPENPEPGWEG
jgi:recombination protein RecT